MSGTASALSTLEAWPDGADAGLVREGLTNRSLAPRPGFYAWVAALIVGLGVGAVALAVAVARGRARTARDHARRRDRRLLAEERAHSPGYADPIHDRRDPASAGSPGEALKRTRTTVATILLWLALAAVAFCASAAITTIILDRVTPPLPRSKIVRVTLPPGLPSPHTLIEELNGHASGR